MKNIIETAVEAGTFATLVAAVKAAGLVETLNGKGPFTVFAPTEDAFKNLPAGTVESLLKPENKAKLAAILSYHVVSGKANAADVAAKKEWKTVEGSVARITTENGVIHVIDATINGREKSRLIHGRTGGAIPPVSSRLLNQVA
jgi:uncharacterized surface protein with fasciclin (FAS1) repeats